MRLGQDQGLLFPSASLRGQWVCRLGNVIVHTSTHLLSALGQRQTLCGSQVKELSLGEIKDLGLRCEASFWGLSKYSEPSTPSAQLGLFL